MKSWIKKVWRKNKYKKASIVVGGLLVFVGLGYLTWQVLNSPSHGTIKLAPATPSSRQQLPEYTSLENEYFKLDIPGGYSSKPIQAAGDETVAYAYEAVSDDPSEKPKSEISIIMRLAQPGGITLDKDYQKYFIKSQKDYSFSNKYYHGEAIDLAVKQTGGTDQAALWLHNGYVLVIKVNKDRDNKQLDVDLKDILTGVQWATN